VVGGGGGPSASEPPLAQVPILGIGFPTLGVPEVETRGPDALTLRTHKLKPRRKET